MARYHGTITGSRQPAARVGTQESGISATITSGSSEKIETAADIAIGGPTPGDELVYIGITHRDRLVFDVEIDAASVADAMIYDPDVRQHLKAIERQFTYLKKAASAARDRRIKLALRHATIGERS